jgi:hypothetical protein
MTTHPALALLASRCSALCDRLAPFAPGLVAVAGVLALLLAFQQVVASSVENSQARHRASAERADAMWRCNAVRGVAQRAGCLAQLDSATP